MKTPLMSLLILGALAALAGCHQAAAPATVQNEVDKARADAQETDAKATQDQVKTDNEADSDVSKAEEKAHQKKAERAYDTAVTAAEGKHEIALARCDGLSGDDRKACKDQADADLALTKANAKAQKATYD
ncbi:MAG TPA: hypothetical protein VJQ47_12000 [Steroidobacteraceae bacterium]|nr:hypothetical protein [Steroidobacteraceae bacterium]